MSERFAWIYDPIAGVKRWCADMWSRRHILTLQDDVSDLQTAVRTIPTKTSDLANDSGFITASDVPDASTATPAMDGTAAVGTSDDYARADHVHPSDSSKQDALSSAQMNAVNSGITADDLAVNNASVLCAVTPISPTLRAGANYASYGNCYYYKVGHRVTVHVGVSGLTANTRTTLWYMPVGYRPKAPVSAVGIAQDIIYRSMVRISESGGTVSVYSEGTYALIEVSYDAYQ